MPGKGADLALKASDRGRNQRYARFHAGIRDGQASGEIVGSVQHHVRPFDERGRIAGPDSRIPDGHVERRVEGLYPVSRDDGFAMADVARGVDRLALEIGQIDRIVIDEGEAPDPGPGQILQPRRADAAQPHQHDMRSCKPRLPRPANLGQDDVAGKTVEAVVGQVGHGSRRL